MAQTATVRGTITDENGDPLPGAAVRIEGNLNVGASTNVDGEYEINSVPLGEQTLLATFVGFNEVSETVTLTEGAVVVVDFVLLAGIELEGISVDALGFAQNTDQLGTSQSSVAGEAIQRSGETSVLRALSAKAPGLNVTASGGDPGSATRIVIRGPNSIQTDNQPLIVIDGVPVFNSTTGGGGVEGVQASSRLNDLNPEDIQSVEVLRSASAAALWGSRAQAGVIVITTKKGQAGRANRPAVSFSSRISIDELNRAPDLQTTYGQGNNGIYQYVPGGGRSWGDRIASRPGGADEVDESGAFAVGQITGNRYYPVRSGTLADPNGGRNSQETFSVYDDLFQNGVYSDNNLSVSGNDANGQYFLSAGYLSQDGIVKENSNLERASVRLNAQRNLSSQLNVSGQASYVRSTSDRIQQGSNLSGIFLGGLRQSVDFDATDYLVDYFPDGEEGAAFLGRQRGYRDPLGSRSTGSIYDNPLFTINRSLNTSQINRFQGQVASDYSVIDWVTLTARLGSDYFTDRRFIFYPQFSSEQGGGQQAEQGVTQFQVNGDLLARANRDLTDDVSGTFLLGLNLNHRETDFITGTLTGFTLPIFPLGVDAPYRNLGNGANENVVAGTGQSVRRTLGYFGEAAFDLYDQIFVNLTGRFDQASTFGPESDDLFFYPSASLAWQFSETLGGSAGPLSFGKIRASYGEVGSEPDPYLSQTYFNPAGTDDGFTSFGLDAALYGGGFARSTRLGSAILDPEKKTEFEIGADLRFFGDRLSASAVYYDNSTNNAILNVDVAPSLGFVVQTANAAQIENKGLELSLDAAWPRVGDFSWNTYASWWTNENTVVSLGGAEEVGLAGFVDPSSSLVEGQPFASLFGTRWRRAAGGCTEDTFLANCEPLSADELADGFSIAPDTRVLDANGFPVPAESQGLIGDPNPDWRASIGNTLQYKDLSLNVLLDASIGGQVYNGTRAALSFFGRAGYQDWYSTISAEEAANLVDYVGCTVAEHAARTCASGVAGVSSDATAIQNEDGTYSFRGVIDDFGAGPIIVNEYYYRVGPGSNFTGPSEPWVEDGSFVRLREVTLSYNLRHPSIQRLGLSSINFAATGRNLWLATDYQGIDPETNLTGPGNGQGLDYFNNPSTRSYQFSVRFTY